MSYFLRWTEQPKIDLERKTSIHASDNSVKEMGKKEFSSLYNIDSENVVVVDGYYAEKLDGLCGFLCEATIEEEALEELENAILNGIGIYAGEFHLYEGEMSGEVPDGILFIPEKLIK